MEVIIAKDKSDIKSVSIRIPVNLLKELHYVADYEGRSANSQILHLIRNFVQDFKNKHGEIELDN